MKNYFNHKPLLLLFLVMVTVCSCTKFVEVKPNPTITVTENVFDQDVTATAAQLAIYVQMQTYLADMSWATGLSSDELKNYSSAETSRNLYANNLNTISDATNLRYWRNGYNMIYQANAVIEALSKSSGVTSAVKKQLTGEAKFIRAYWYFNLVNLYGNVPLVLTTDYKVNVDLTRTSKDTVYRQIITDLTDAQQLLNADYVDASGTAITSDRVRPNKAAAAALQARAYLFTGSWANAESQASSVINNSLYSLPNPDSAFLKNNNEAIWQLQPASTNKNTAEGDRFIILNNPATTSGTYIYALSDTLVNSFEPGDLRRTKWIGAYTATNAPAGTYYFAYKYKASGRTVPTNAALANTEYSMVLRLAEQYLIRAEARAQQNNLTGAVDNLNTIRNRAGLPDYAGAMDQISILAAIMHERQVELFTESHRWFDLKRTNTVDAVMTGIAPIKKSSWHSYQQLYPIPNVDINNSVGKIVQNTGY